MNKKEKILKAASTVVKKFGFVKTTLDDIARECGMKNTALYYYFKSKEEIMNEMFETDMKQIRENIKKAVAKQKTPKEKIRAFILKKLSLLKTQRRYFNLIIKEDISFKLKQFALEEKNKFDRFEKELLTRIISEGIKSDLFANHPIDSVIYTISGTTWGISYFILQNEQETNINEIVNDLVNIIFKGLEKR